MNIVICGYFGIRNVGDEAILFGLRKMFLKLFPNASISVMGKGNLFPFGLRSFFKSLLKPAYWARPYYLIKKCDYFVMSGGLFTDEEGIFISTFWLLHGLAAHFLKKPVLLLGVNIGRLYIWNLWLAKKLFRASKLIIVRDEASLQKLSQWGIMAHKGSDFAAFTEYKKTAKEEKEPYVVLCARPFKKAPNFLYTNLAQFCDILIEEYGLYIRLIPFHEGSNSDVKVLNTIFTHIENKSKVKIDAFYENPTHLMEILSNASLVIGMRLHAGILATLAGTPFIGISYMEKVSNFWHKQGIKTLSIGEISVDNLSQEFRNIYNSDRQQRSIIKNIQESFFKKAKETEETVKLALQN